VLGESVGWKARVAVLLGIGRNVRPVQRFDFGRRRFLAAALRHVDKDLGEQLYRILVYDCAPLSKKAHNPVSGRAIDFSKLPLLQLYSSYSR
jgi:hypothetical protein